jgi:ATP-dependent exoDNAse (exonuclease V) beta subunit
MWSLEKTASACGIPRWLDRARLTGDDEGEASVEAPRGVSLITIHASKGLEYPIVMLANVGGRHKHSTPSKLVDRNKRQLQARIGSEERGEFKTAGFDARLEEAKGAEEAEKVTTAVRRHDPREGSSGDPDVLCCR